MTSNTPLKNSPETTRGKILVVDDEAELTNALCEMLAKQGYVTQGFTNGNLALETLRQESFDVLLADLMMPEMDGIALLKSALEIDPNLISIIMTGQGTVQTAVDAMKSGAFDYIMKPFKLNTVLSALARSLEVRHLRMENVQLQESLRIYELGQVIAFTLDTQVIMQKMVEAALQQCQGDEVTILLPEDDEPELTIAAVNAGREALLGRKVPLEGTISGWAARNFETLVLNGAVQDARFAPVFIRPEIKTSIVMPMVSGRKLIGVLTVNRVVHNTPVTNGQIKGLSLLVGMAASAIENAHLYEQTENRLRKLSALRTIDLAITSSMDMRLTLDIVLEQVMSQLAVDAAAVLLLNPQSQYLEYAAGRGFRTTTLEHVQILLSQGNEGKAALERQTLLVPDLNQSALPLDQQPLITSEAFKSSFIAPLTAKGEVQGILEVFTRSPFTPGPEWLSFFEALAGQAAIAIDNAQLFNNLQLTNQQLMLAYNATIEGWSHALDLRDKETEGHTQRVTEMTLRLARVMGGFSEEDLVQIRRGALLHDIGKMGVPDSILLKPGELTPEEEQVMRKHPEYAYQLLSPILYLRKALDIPHYHHEWWDGSGYPAGLQGEQIPIAARLFAVVDVWDALRSDRPYRSGWPEAKVLDYIQDLSGKQFDPQVAAAFVEMLKKYSG